MMDTYGFLQPSCLTPRNDETSHTSNADDGKCSSLNSRRKQEMTRDAKAWYAPADQCRRAGGTSSWIKGIRVLCLLILISITTFSCLNIQVRMGRRPDPSVLKTLLIGKSTPAEVLAALGEPFGSGKAMLPVESRPKTMWSYYYGEGSMKDARATYLFVFFDQNRYDGYMWFSSLPK
jgi:hypothetical protein